jgi:hypothetical protein
MSLRHRQKLELSCPHETTMTTVTAGIRRVVCEACGNVSIRLDRDVPAEQPAQKEPVASNV